MRGMMRFRLDGDLSVSVEVDEDSVGLERVSRSQDGVVAVGRRLAEASGGVRDATGVDGSAENAATRAV